MHNDTQPKKTDFKISTLNTQHYHYHRIIANIIY